MNRCLEHFWENFGTAQAQPVAGRMDYGLLRPLDLRTCTPIACGTRGCEILV